MNRTRIILVIFFTLMCVSTTDNLRPGQNSLLLMLPLTLAWLAARRGNWNKMAIFMGVLMSLKLFLVIFLPYLAVKRQFRAVALASLLALSCFAVGAIFFGLEAQRAWVEALSGINWSRSPTNMSVLGFLTRSFSESQYFAPIFVAPGLIKPLWIVVSGLMGLLTLGVSVRDTSEHAVDRAFALLLLAAFLISPLGWVYYLWLAAGPLILITQGWYRRNPVIDTPKALAVRLRDCLLIMAIPGLIWPLSALFWFEPNRWATLLIGSIYFWSTLAIWLGLLVDWVGRSSTPACKPICQALP